MSSAPTYFELLESYSHVVYPALAILVTVMIVAGILQAWRTSDLDGLAKMELKREIVLELRRQIGGQTADELARTLSLEAFKVVRLLEEMQSDGVLVSHTNTARHTIWQVRTARNSGAR